ncbi:DUF5103 domain-containing protein [Porphyromonas sp. COT-290 OH860]|uniref:type IX secretion system plug protein n=1 Tax=Porphyromonas sp. COT-290 OH860 TaxID=1515615 RepID=UPI000693F858|nr:DUF5103 domain-containing protein [Porphyromonas sp. COT-290 OH860]
MLRLKSILLGCAVLASSQEITHAQEEGKRIGYIEVQTQGRNSPKGLAPRFSYMHSQGEGLRIDFDLLGSEEPILAYRIRHCNADWSISSLSPIEYLIGFDGNELPYPTSSRSTLQPYVHYSLELPNEQVQFKHSGNYIVEIYDSSEPDTPVATIPFAVTEQLTEVKAEQTTQTWVDARAKHQQVNVEVSTRGLQINRAEEEIKIVVLQNGRWDNAQKLSVPSSQTLGTLRYDMNRGALFAAGNEYHKLEHLTDRGAGMGIDRIWVEDGLHALGLYPQRMRARDSYLYEEDRNGRSIVRSLQTDVPEVEADYHLVHFSYYAPPLTSGRIVLEGQCFAHLPLEERTLRYEAASGSYHAEILLKMGYQEYQYLYLPEGAQTLSSTETEGNHYQTSNDYTVLVYLRSPRDRADRLIAVAEL